jgi:hypothetical protein
MKKTSRRGGAAHSSALTDFVIQTRQARIFVTGPQVIKQGYRRRRKCGGLEFSLMELFRMPLVGGVSVSTAMLPIQLTTGEHREW